MSLLLSSSFFLSSFPSVRWGLKAAPSLDEVLPVSMINEPELAGGQSSAVGVTAPIGTAKWLNSDKFIVVPPAGAWDKQGGVGSRPRQHWCELVLAGLAQSGSNRLSVPQSQGRMCVYTSLIRQTDRQMGGHCQTHSPSLNSQRLQNLG